MYWTKCNAQWETILDKLSFLNVRHYFILLRVIICHWAIFLPRNSKKAKYIKIKTNLKSLWPHYELRAVIIFAALWKLKIVGFFYLPKQLNPICLLTCMAFSKIVIWQPYYDLSVSITPPLFTVANAHWFGKWISWEGLWLYQQGTSMLDIIYWSLIANKPKNVPTILQ